MNISPDTSFYAALLIHFVTFSTVAFFVSSDCTSKPFDFAISVISSASNSHAVNCPSYPE